MIVDNINAKYNHNIYNKRYFQKTPTVVFCGNLCLRKQAIISVEKKSNRFGFDILSNLFKKEINNKEEFKKFLQKKLQAFGTAANIFTEGYKNLLEVGNKNPNFIDRIVKLIKSGCLTFTDGFTLSKDNPELLAAELCLYEKIYDKYKFANFDILFSMPKADDKITMEDVEAKICLIDKFNPKRKILDNIKYIVSHNIFPDTSKNKIIRSNQLSFIEAINSINKDIVNDLVAYINMENNSCDDYSIYELTESLKKITKENADIIKKLTNNIPVTFIPVFIDKITKENMHIFKKLTTQKFIGFQLERILKHINDDNIKFLSKLIDNKVLSNQYKHDIFMSYNEYSANSLNYIFNPLRKNNIFILSIKDIQKFGFSINKDNQKYADKWIKMQNINIHDLTEILIATNFTNIELADNLILDKDFSKAYIPSVIQHTETPEICRFISRLHSTTKINHKQLIEISKKLQYLDKVITSRESEWNIEIALNTANQLKEQYAEIMDECKYDIDKKINALYVLLQAKQDKEYFEPDASGIKNLFTQLLSNNNPKTEHTLKTADFNKYKKQGIPLKYTRSAFFENISEKILKDVKAEDKYKILNYFGIIKGENTFDGILQNKDVKGIRPFLKSDKGKDAVNKIREEIVKFSSENEVITKDSNLDQILNALIKGIPAFVSIIGKKQHSTHDYSIDVHSLKVLQSAMNNPEYNTLSDESKMIIKLSAILHDIGKKEGVVDKGHAGVSTDITKTILDTLPLKTDVKTRIINIVANHHWFEEYNRYPRNSASIAVMCRYPEDFEIYKILAKADLESVNPRFHFDVTKTRTQKEFDQYIDKKTEDIKIVLSQIYNSANFIFNTKILNKGKKFPEHFVEIDKQFKRLKVLNLNKIDNSEDLTVYGFPNGTRKKDLRFFVHMLDAETIRDLENAKKILDEQEQNHCWSVSFIKTNKNSTYRNRQFGLIFDVNQSDISEAQNVNIGSGYKKTIYDFQYGLVSNNKERVFVKNSFLKRLKKNGIKLNSKDYLDLVKHITKKKYLTAIKHDFYAGKTLINAKKLVNSIKEAEENLFEGNQHNEVVVLNPKLQGIFIKSKSIEYCPDFILNFAYKYDLPIIIMKPA